MELAPEVFAMDFQEKRLLQYKLEGKEKEGKGPLIVLVDNSGSMSGAPNVWSRAIMVALTNQATMENRAFCAALYDTEVKGTFDFAKNQKASLEDVLEFISVRPDGGTDIKSAVEWAVTARLQEPKADVVIISDGIDRSIKDSGWRSIIKAAKSTMNFRIYGVLIDSKESKEFTELCDNHILINDLQNQAREAAKELFQKVGE